MDTRISIDSEALLEQVNWVRALARRLVRDAGEAEDVAQDALVVALRGARQEPRALTRQEPRALKRWLGAVVRNLSRNAARREGRRSRMEAPLQEEPAIPSTLELLEQASTQRSLVGTLLELEEPDRSVLLLRYFQELSNEEIARHCGVPASTVATRLARAHARLRAKWLAQNGGDRRTGLAALVALARGVAESSPAPAVQMGTAAATGWSLGGALQAAGLVGVLVGAAWWLRSTLAQEPDPLSARSSQLVAASAQTPLGSSAAPASVPAALAASSLRDQRSAVETPPIPSAPVCPAPEGQRHPIRGRVLDLEGRPVAGLEVCRIRPLVSLPDGSTNWRGVPTEDRATSDGDGRFTIDAPMLGWLAASSPGWTTVLGGELWLAEADESLLVVARSRPLGGQVVDEQGGSLAGVRVGLEIAPQRLLALGQVLDSTVPIPRTFVTDEHGAFAFDDAPRGDVLVSAWKEGFERGVVELERFTDPEGSRPETLRVVLKRSSLPTVTGTVVDASGRPVAGASVSAGQGIVASDAAGAFLVTFDPEHWSSKPCAEHGHPSAEPGQGLIAVRAVRAGLGLAEREIVVPPVGSPPVTVRLVLAGEARMIEGRVIDPRGDPVASVEVFVLEDTPFGWEPVESRGSIFRSLESVLGACPARTSLDGSFLITGLTERSYRLQVLDSTRLLSTVSDPIPSGNRSVRLVFDPEARGPIAGRIVDRDGRPVEGVRMAVSCRQWWSGPGDRDASLAIGASTETDPEGRFALQDVAREGIFLRLEGDSIVPEIFRDIDPDADRSRLELVVGRRCHLQFQWADWSERADRLHLEAEDGSALGFMDLRGTSVTPLDWIAVGTGLSPAFTIPDRAAHAVLTREGREVSRVRLTPIPGELELVQL